MRAIKNLKKERNTKEKLRKQRCFWALNVVVTSAAVFNCHSVLLNHKNDLSDIRIKFNI